MSQNPKPSQLSVNQAYDLGKLLATSDPRLTPVLEGAHQYLSYVQFMLAHRHRLQQANVFQEWEERLQQITDAEVKHWSLRLDNPRHWEIIENCLSVPLHCAFWFGWETVYNLKHKFETAVATWNAAHPIQPRRDESPDKSSTNERHPAPPGVHEDWEAKPGQDVPHSPAIVRNAEGVAH